MSFQLVIAEGKEAGREFVFDQTSVLIGRTSECDVVLYDPGVSRKHARIFSEGDIYYVEDMGSSNGTKVNGAIVKRRQLTDGDAITLGPVVFNFSGHEDSLGEEPSTDAAAPAGDPNTRIVSQADVARRPRRGGGEALAPEGAQPDQLKALARSSTRTSLEAVRRTSGPGLRPEGLARTDGDVPVRRTLSAADKARLRRSGGAGSFKLFWLEASGATRGGIAFALLVLLGALGYGAYEVFKPAATDGAGPEVTALVGNEAPIEQTFGFGDGVDFEHVDSKSFDYELSSPVKVVVVLHYQAKEISDKEVVVQVNGQDVGFVPPDSLTVDERVNEFIVPPSVLNRNALNKIVFDNVKNPPGKETWRIWNLGIEAFPLPVLPADELLSDALKDYAKGENAMKAAGIAADNTYKAWRAFRDAWLKLESLEGQKPPEYQMARERVRVAQAELDKLCAKLLLEANTEYNQKQFQAARSTLEHVNNYFPPSSKRDQMCAHKAAAQREQWDL